MRLILAIRLLERMVSIHARVERATSLASFFAGLPERFTPRTRRAGDDLYAITGKKGEVSIHARVERATRSGC